MHREGNCFAILASPSGGVPGIIVWILDAYSAQNPHNHEIHRDISGKTGAVALKLTALILRQLILSDL
jgi:hypothetical protein